jgi:anti-sigma factor RsiW
MNEDFELKLQAYLDGELSEKETREVEARLVSDAQSKALLSELQNTRAAFLMFEKEMKLPESREFFWSKIVREIRGLEAKPEHAHAKTSWLAPLFLRRALIPIGSFAAILLAAVFTFKQASISSKTTDFDSAEIAMNDSEAFTYTDHSSGMTVVWLSYPAENQNQFTDTDSSDTLQ